MKILKIISIIGIIVSLIIIPCMGIIWSDSNEIYVKLLFTFLIFFTIFWVGYLLILNKL